MTLHSKLLSITGKHYQLNHSEDCTDCIQDVNDIVQAFIDHGWTPPKEPLDQARVDEYIEQNILDK